MTFDDQLRRAFDMLSDRLRGEIDRQVQSAMDELSTSARAEADAAIAAAVAAVPAPMAVDVPHTDAHSPVAGARHLVDAIHAIDRAPSLTAVLDTLLTAVTQEGAGAGVWLLRGGRLRHWRSVGLNAWQTDVPLDDHRALAEAARTNAPAAGDDGFAVPIALAGQVVAVLQTANPASQSNPASEANPESRVPSPESRIPNPESVEVLTRYAARSLEALTAFKTARAMTDRAEGAGHAAPAHPSAAADDDTGSEEHVAARRYARLLVSEIKLYHEDAVMEGRRDRDLATRLGGEIARARVMYEQRVPPQVRQHADHFHDELVRTLADGDASLLELRT